MKHQDTLVLEGRVDERQGRTALEAADAAYLIQISRTCEHLARKLVLRSAVPCPIAERTSSVLSKGAIQPTEGASPWRSA